MRLFLVRRGFLDLALLELPYSFNSRDFKEPSIQGIARVGEARGSAAQGVKRDEEETGCGRYRLSYLFRLSVNLYRGSVSAALAYIPRYRIRFWRSDSTLSVWLPSRTVALAVSPRIIRTEMYHNTRSHSLSTWCTLTSCLSLSENFQSMIEFCGQI